MIPMVIALYVATRPITIGNFGHTNHKPSFIHIHFSILDLRHLLEDRACPHCNHSMPALPRWQHSIALLDDNAADQGQTCGQQPSFTRAYVDEDARESSEYQTSGFGTPRQSVDTLGSSTRESGEGLTRGDVMNGEPATSLV